MRGGTPSQGLWMPPRIATLFVAANNSLDKCRAQADYICDGVADDVQINAALNDLPAHGGMVVLSEGTFNLVNSIVIPKNRVILKGQGAATLVDGDGLTTNNHCVNIVDRNYCEVRDMRVCTTRGEGKTSHCVNLEGCYYCVVDGIIIDDSDSDGIHVGGLGSQYLTIIRCHIQSAEDHAINISPNALAFSCDFIISNNLILAPETNGINFGQCTGGHKRHIIIGNIIDSAVSYGIAYDVATVPVVGVMECTIVGNNIQYSGTDGILLLSDSDNNLIENNFINGCGGYGINIGGPTCGENRIMNNKLIGNVTGQINDAGVYTQLPEIFIPVPNPSSNIGTHPCEQLTDGLEVVSRLNVCIPLNFQELVTCEAVVVPGDTGNFRRSVATNWGEIASGEAYNSDSGAVAEGNVAVTATQVEGIDIAAAFVGVGALGPGDIVGVAFTRHGDDVLDTVDADCWLLGIRMRYV